MQKRILSLLVLLMTAATGAWAVSAVASIGSENYTTLQAAFTAAETGQTIKLLSDVTQAGGVGKHDGKAVTFDLNGHIYTCSTEDYVVVATDNSQITIIDSSTGTPGGIKSQIALVSQDNGKIIIKAGRYNIGDMTAEELLEYFPLWGVEMYSGYTLQDITPADAQGFCVGVVAPTYTVALKDGTEDATNWQGKAGTGEYQSLPLTGLEASTAVSVKYSGTKMVKSVKAVKKAVPVTTYTLLSAATTEDVGKVVCAAGHLHDAKTAVPAGCTAVGILGKVTATGHGLILALQDATSQNWNTINGWTSVTTYAGTTLKVLPDDAARGTNLTSYTALGSTAVSNWAVAQKSDYDAIFTNLGSTTGDSNGKTYDANVNAYITTGVGGTAISGDRWSATKVDDTYAWRFHGNSWRNGTYKTSVYSFRPVLGF